MFMHIPWSLVAGIDDSGQSVILAVVAGIGDPGPAVRRFSKTGITDPGYNISDPLQRDAAQRTQLSLGVRPRAVTIRCRSSLP